MPAAFRSFRAARAPLFLAFVFAAVSSAALAGVGHRGGPHHGRVQMPGWDREDRWAPSDSLVARWWQYYLSIPTPIRNALGESVEACGLGQSGDTWLLTQVGVPDVPTTSHCVIPKGTTLFIPVITSVCIPYPGETLRDNVQICREAIDVMDRLNVTIDGRQRNGLIERRAQSKAFPVWMPEENFFDVPDSDVPAGVYSAVAEGYYITLGPLSVGHHTIRATAASSSDPTAPAFDATYEIDIVAPTSITPR